MRGGQSIREAWWSHIIASLTINPTIYDAAPVFNIPKGDIREVSTRLQYPKRGYPRGVLSSPISQKGITERCPLAPDIHFTDIREVSPCPRYPFYGYPRGVPLSSISLLRIFERCPLVPDIPFTDIREVSLRLKYLLGNIREVRTWLTIHQFS